MGKKMNYQSGDVVANGTRLHYYRTGGKKTAMVLLHGVTDDGLCWSPVADALADQFDVVMVDLRGHGKSDAPEDGYTLTVMADDVAALINDLGLIKPIIMGHSMGAITTMTLAGLYPDIARAIVLEDPPQFWMIKQKEPNEPQKPNPLALWIASNKRKTKEDLYEEVRTFNPLWAEVELEPWVNSKLRYSPKIVKLVEMVDLSSMGFEQLFKKISCPALLLTADCNKGAILGEKDVEPIKLWIPQLDVGHIDSAGHNIRRDQFDKYMNVVQYFLAEIGL